MPTTIVQLPESILENIFSNLEYNEINYVSKVCSKFKSASEEHLKKEMMRILKDLWIKMDILKEHMSLPDLEPEDKIRLNQTYTSLQILNMNLYSMYVLGRHCIDRNVCLILDNLRIPLNEMNFKQCNNWYEQCTSLQNAIIRYNISNTPATENTNNFPFGIHVMDILDILLGVNYKICCTYNTKNNTCSISARYNTEDFKFLSYLPDIAFLKDCDDRAVNDSEKESILRYLMLLANLHNGLYCKAEEYKREKMSEAGPSKKRFKFWRQHVSRIFLDDGNITETYEKVLNRNNEFGLLHCEISLKCSLTNGPYQIVKSYEALRKDIALEENFDCLVYERNDTDVYGIVINLHVPLQHKCTQLYEICIRDGLALNEH